MSQNGTPPKIIHATPPAKTYSKISSKTQV
nr:MAG TPA: hypothetical protein [Caudoviricetes sp.]